MTDFNAAEWEIDWPTTATGIVEEALRDYVGDGEGVDRAVLAAHDREVREATKAGIWAVIENVDSYRHGKNLYGHERDYADGYDAGMDAAGDLVREWEPDQ